MKDEGSHNQSLAPSFASFSLLLISKLPSSSFLISDNSYRYWNAQKEHKLHLLQANILQYRRAVGFPIGLSSMKRTSVTNPFSSSPSSLLFSLFMFFAHWTNFQVKDVWFPKSWRWEWYVPSADEQKMFGFFKHLQNAIAVLAFWYSIIQNIHDLEASST